MVKGLKLSGSGFGKVSAKDKFFAGVKTTGKAIGKGAGTFASGAGKAYNASEKGVSKVYNGSHKTIVEHRRRILAREEFKTKKLEHKTAQHLSKQQLPYNSKPAYRGLADEKKASYKGLADKERKKKYFGLSDKKHRGKEGFF